MTGAVVRYEEPQPRREVTANAWVDLVQPAADLAAMIAATDFVPVEMRNKTAAIAACVLYGAEVGIGPMQSLAKVDIVKGRPAPRAELARALALSAGHEIWVEEQTNTRCKVAGRRRGSQQMQSVTWTMDDVRKAGISNGAYAKYPRQMLFARASAELVRMLCPDVLGGIGLFAEEAADADDVAAAGPVAPVAPVVEETPSAAKRKRKPMVPAQEPPTPPAVEPVEDDALPPLPGELDDVDGITAAQLRALHAALTAAGITDRDDRLAFATAVVGRPVDSSKALGRDEASAVIDAAADVEHGRLHVTRTDHGEWLLERVDDEEDGR